MYPMLRHARYYFAGIVCVILYILVAELIWLPAPLRLSSGRLWMDMIDELLYGLAIIPLLWGLARRLVSVGYGAIAAGAGDGCCLPFGVSLLR